MLNARYMTPATRHDGRYSVHQDLVARRCDPSHAGADRGAQGAARRALSPGWWRRPSRRWCALHPAVDEVDPGGLAALAEVALCAGDARRDRRQPARHPGAALRRDRRQPGPAALRRHRAPARMAGGTATTRRSIREPLAAMFYDVRHRVSRDLHAVERNRILSGLALGYAPQGAPDFGLDRARFAGAGERYAVLLHATARRASNGRRRTGSRSARRSGDGSTLVLPWGTRSRAGAQRTASPPRCRARACPSARRSTRSRG